MTTSIPVVSAVNPAAQISATLEAALLKIGQSLDARVLSQQANGTTRLATHAGLIELEISQPLAPGTQVRLDVQKTPQGQQQILVTIQPHQTAADGNSQTVFQPANTGTTNLLNAQTSGGSAAVATQTAMGTPLANATQAAPAQAGNISTGTSAQNAVREVLTQTIRQAATDQHSMAPLLANLDAITRGDSPALPASVRAAASALLGLALPAEQASDADALSGMVQKSGLFQEANLANARTGQALALDLKTALLHLKAVLTAMAGESGAPPFLGGLRPPPPRRGAATVATAQEQATISKQSDGAATIKTLLAQTDGALDRLRLMQIASLPEQSPQPAGPGQNTVTTQHLIAEFPIAYTPQHTGVMHLQVDHEAEKGKPGQSNEERTWKVRFAVDIDTVGPVHALIMMKGGFANIQIWAERPQTAMLFNNQLADLRTSLAEAHLEVDDIQCRAGVPLQPAPTGAKAAGTFLDRQT